MTAYYNDLKLFFQKAGAFPAQTRRAARRARFLGLHAAARRRATTPRPCRRRCRRPGSPSWRACRATSPASRAAIVKLRDTLRAERDARLSHQRLGHERRHRAVESARRHRGRARRRAPPPSTLARRQLRHRLRRVQRSRRGVQPVRLRRRRPARGGTPTTSAATSASWAAFPRRRASGS